MQNGWMWCLLLASAACKLLKGKPAGRALPWGWDHLQRRGGSGKGGHANPRQQQLCHEFGGTGQERGAVAVWLGAFCSCVCM